MWHCPQKHQTLQPRKPGSCLTEAQKTLGRRLPTLLFCSVFTVMGNAGTQQINLIFLRLVKGDGEIIEEVVSYQRHKEINKVMCQSLNNILIYYSI